MNKFFGKLLCFLFFPIALTAQVDRAQEDVKKKPNILFISIDNSIFFFVEIHQNLDS